VEASAATAPDALLGPTLRDVSRAFYLTLRVLPAGMREPVGLAYLLARAADTVADTEALPPSRRLQHLLELRERIDGRGSDDTLARLAALSADHADAGERRLMERLPAALERLERLSGEDRARVRRIVAELTTGMELDLQTFPAAGEGRIVALGDADALDRYTYLVAGCVGEFWTATARAHTVALASWDERAMTALGVRFGKALQLTNVLRDVSRDLRIGRCYLPLTWLEPLGIAPGDLLDPANGERARPALVRGIELALGHFDAAERYLLAIPRRCYRLRLAVLWPLVIGLATLGRLARHPHWLDPARPAKVPRNAVYLILGTSLKLEPFDTALGGWIGLLRRRVRRALL
jgi:farnesyl-diphosphate farnesyltransferase